jgi:hypothetical protein
MDNNSLSKLSIHWDRAVDMDDAIDSVLVKRLTQTILNLGQIAIENPDRFLAAIARHC